MRTSERVKRSAAKQALTGGVLVLALVLGACGGRHMLAQETKPAITARSGKAVLVIIRTTAYGWGTIVDNYLDGKMIGQTYGKVFFTTEVSPGVHYVISHADNTDTARLNFEAGKIYILQQGVFPGYHATTAYSPLAVDQFQKEVQEAAYVVYDTQHPVKDMDPKDVKEAKGDFDKEVKEGKHKEILQYKGVKRLK